jgi:hypothetical protein
MATNTIEQQPTQAVEVSRAPGFQWRRADTQAQSQDFDFTPEATAPLTKSSVDKIINPDAVCPSFSEHIQSSLTKTQPEPRFAKGDKVRKTASAPGGAQTKAAYTIYKCRTSQHGWIEYQLQDYYTLKVDGSWTREKHLKAGA